MKKKTFCLFVLLLFSLAFVQAQEKPSFLGREIGLKLYPSWGNVGQSEILWKKQKDSLTWRRLRGGIAGAAAIGNANSQSVSGNISISFGTEKRKPIGKNDSGVWKDMQFVYGSDCTVGVGGGGGRSRIPGQPYTYTQNANLTLGVNAVLGVIYTVNKQFYVGAEVLPGIGLTSGVNRSLPPNSTPLTNYYTRFNLSTSGLTPSLLVMYCFDKRKK